MKRVLDGPDRLVDQDHDLLQSQVMLHDGFVEDR